MIQAVFLLKGHLPFLHPVHSLCVSEELYPFGWGDLYFIFKCNSTTRSRKERCEFFRRVCSLALLLHTNAKWQLPWQRSQESLLKNAVPTQGALAALSHKTQRLTNGKGQNGVAEAVRGFCSCVASLIRGFPVMVRTWSRLPREVGRGSEEPGGEGDRVAAHLDAAPALGGEVKKFRPY